MLCVVGLLCLACVVWAADLCLVCSVRSVCSVYPALSELCEFSLCVCMCVAVCYVAVCCVRVLRSVVVLNFL